ncbi:hypothetical protein U9R90_32860 [Streptomyces sp. E11-3]|uniref:hypothetical protein n=1 Tax=Streptomyces sp. E11-3 TaxID=3110112 RepID=UPI00397EBBAE
MRPTGRNRLTLALCAAVAAGGVGLMPTAVLAADAGSVKVSPAKATPGSEVELQAAGCDGTTGVAKSEAFVAEADLTGRDGKGFPLSGEAMIRSTVSPGTYEVTVNCDGKDGKVKGELEVVQSKPSPDKPSPTAPIRAGGGGTADDTADTVSAAEGQSTGTGYALFGALFGGAAALVVAGLVRRRRRPR